MKRYLNESIIADLKKKMVFIGGPRQVGKTTLALDISQDLQGYLNWDIPKHRELILKNSLPNTATLIFDEIHKYKSWRNYIKGVFDQWKGKKQILVTGSAKLDYYRRGGDSLQGRYFYYRLHPLSIAELNITSQADLEQLLEFSGFPEPFLSESKKDSKRWSLDYRTRLINEDIRNLENVADLGNLELLIMRLPELVGSPLSINSLRNDLLVAHKTVAKWLSILERTYTIFRLSPFASNRIKSVRKEQKHYHYDWSLVPDKGARFENLVACHLIKWCHFLRDTEGRELDLCYYRDSQAREVDFVIVENKKPLQFIECKHSATDISKNLVYVKNKFPEAEAIQLYCLNGREIITKDGITNTSAIKFLSNLV